jgi:hypothetical protein
MKCIREKLIILPFMLLIVSSVYSQSLNKAKNIFISVNLVKFVMGLPNLEFEYSISERVSIYMFNYLWSMPFEIYFRILPVEEK